MLEFFYKFAMFFRMIILSRICVLILMNGSVYIYTYVESHGKYISNGKCICDKGALTLQCGHDKRITGPLFPRLAAPYRHYCLSRKQRKWRLKHRRCYLSCSFVLDFVLLCYQFISRIRGITAQVVTTRGFWVQPVLLIAEYFYMSLILGSRKSTFREQDDT